VGRNAISSSDAMSWSPVLPPLRDFQEITFAAGRFVAVNTTDIAVSADGERWLTNRMPNVTAEGKRALTFGCAGFTTIGATGIFTSADGERWRQQPSPTTGLQGIAYFEGQYIAVGQNGLIFTTLCEDSPRIYPGSGEDGAISFSFAGRPEKRFQLQTAPSLQNPVWQETGGPVQPGDEIVANTQGEKAFFRVVQSEP
jgi:hypothetical protein